MTDFLGIELDIEHWPPKKKRGPLMGDPGDVYPIIDQSEEHKTIDLQSKTITKRQFLEVFDIDKA